MTAADQIEAARALIEPLTGANPGPWEATYPTGEGCHWIAPQYGQVSEHGYMQFSGMGSRAIAAMICAAPALRDTVADLADGWEAERARADAQAQEIERLQAENERLHKMLQPEWFYLFDGCDGESTYDSVPDLLDEHYFWDRPKTGQHVVKIEAVTTLPSIWAAVRFNCNCADPEDCECDNDMIVTQHASEAEALVALGETP